MCQPRLSRSNHSSPDLASAPRISRLLRPNVLKHVTPPLAPTCFSTANEFAVATAKRAEARYTTLRANLLQQVLSYQPRIHSRPHTAPRGPTRPRAAPHGPTRPRAAPRHPHAALTAPRGPTQYRGPPRQLLAAPRRHLRGPRGQHIPARLTPLRSVAPRSPTDSRTVAEPAAAADAAGASEQYTAASPHPRPKARPTARR